MIDLPTQLAENYAGKLARSKVPDSYLNFYRKWLRFYLDFCHKYGVSPIDSKSLNPFLEKLQSKKQSPAFQRQAHHAVMLYYELMEKQAKDVSLTESPQNQTLAALPIQAVG